MSMAALDWFFLAVLGLSLCLGAWRGLVYELLSLAGWVLAFWAAQWWAADAGALLPLGAAQPLWRHVAGFALVFVGMIFVCGWLAWLVKKLIDAVGLRPADRALGALFGALRGLLLLLVLALLVGWMQWGDALWWRQSQGAPLLQQALHGLQPVMSQASQAMGRPAW